MRTPMQFYRVFHSGAFGVAYAADGVDGLKLREAGTVTEWAPVAFEIRHGKWEGPPGDFVHNNLGWRLCSERLKELLDSLRSDVDRLQWLPAFVTDLNGKRTRHFILHFSESPDVLNLAPGETIYDEKSGVLIRPSISLEKAKSYRLFNIRGLDVATIMHQSLKRAAATAGMEGIEFRPIRQA